MDKYDLLKYIGVPKRAIQVLRQEYSNTKELDIIGQQSKESLYLCGPVGQGKSIHACSILMSRLFHDVHIKSELELLDPKSPLYDRTYIPFFKDTYLFVNVPKLLHRIKETFNQKNPPEEINLINRCCQANLLVLDDLGAELNTDWAYQTLCLIVSERYNEMMKTIFTSNLPLSKLGAHFDDKRLVSRIIEMCGKKGVLNFSGKNYRQFSP